MEITDLDDPEEYPGVEWEAEEGINYIKSLDFTDKGLPGSFGMSKCSYLEIIKLSGNQFYPGNIKPLNDKILEVGEQKSVSKCYPCQGDAG